jgi:hypothetical protein
VEEVLQAQAGASNAGERADTLTPDKAGDDASGAVSLPLTGKSNGEA